MTSFSKLHKVNRQLIFSPQAAEAAPVVPARPQPLLAADDEFRGFLRIQRSF